MQRNLGIAAAVASLAVTLAACGSSSNKTTTSKPVAKPAAGSTGAGSSLTVAEREYRLTPSTLKIGKGGAITITARNDGTIEHALEVEGSGNEVKTQNIQPGKSATLKLTLKPGRYVMYCPIDGHRALGIRGVIVVGAAGSGSGGSSTQGTSTGSSTGSSRYGY